MGIQATDLFNTMLGAAKPILEEKWPEIEEYAETELKKIAERIVHIEKKRLSGKYSEERAKIHLEMQRDATKSVLLAIEGLGKLAVEQAINSALAAVKDVVNTSLGFALI